ncbi:hypothetical protein KXR53_15040 [Inquilinus limosus]|uniref:hypothetical protein n=1 Tax=Inquilinus limosus TaxID=171674 RepID=UPI003F147E96
MDEPDVTMELLSTAGDRRVLVVRRNGLYVLRAERRYSEFYEGRLIAEGWAEIPSSASYFNDPKAAAREAFFRFPWLRELAR